jgi:CheY-like chemotaxis protein
MAGNLRTVTDVLLATDSDELFATIDSALASDDTNVYRVRRGQDVLPVVEQKDPDLVILDLQIGNMGGVAACIAIRQEEGMDRLAKRPVALLLDKSSDTYIAQQSRADGWLVKPLDPLRLRSLSSALLENGTLFEGLGS